MLSQPGASGFERLARKTDWRHIANSWRLIAERMIAERTGGELSGRVFLRRPSGKPMHYQQSFYSVS